MRRQAQGEIHVRDSLVRWFLSYGSHDQRHMLRALRLEVVQSPSVTFGLEVADFGREAQFLIEHILQSLDAFSAHEPVGKRANSERFAKMAPIDDRVEFLRRSHQERLKNRTFSDVVAIGEAASLTNFTIAEILELETNGLITPQRTHGGQRRFSTFDLKRLADLHERLTLEMMWDGPNVSQTQRAHSGSRRFSGSDLRRLVIKPEQNLITPTQQTFSEDDGPSASMRLPQSSRAPIQNKQAVAEAIRNRKEIKEETMNTVAQLYLEACDRYPNRDKSVVEYIKKNLEWLSDDEIITMIRLARRRGIYLPTYRRGRLPKTSGNLPEDLSIKPKVPKGLKSPAKTRSQSETDPKPE